MQWSELHMKGDAPLARSLHTATLLDGKMYVFGGWVPYNNTGPVESNNIISHTTGAGGPTSERWKCSDTLCIFNLRTNSWENMDTKVGLRLH